MSNFKFDYVKKYILPFGKHKGEKLDDVAKTNEGLLYLDWLYGETQGHVKNMLKVYLEDETIQKELKQLIS